MISNGKVIANVNQSNCVGKTIATIDFGIVLINEKNGKSHQIIESRYELCQN